VNDGRTKERYLLFVAPAPLQHSLATDDHPQRPIVVTLDNRKLVLA
jgi:hypothetical protein